MFYVYILLSLQDNKFYIGQTSNLEDRIERHNKGREKATKNRKPFKLVYFEKYDTRAGALKREKHLKSLKSHAYVQELINSSTG